MKRTSLLITFTIIIITGGVIWISQFYNDRKITPWDLIGDDAAIVFELSNLASINEKIDGKSSLSRILNSNASVNRLASNRAFYDSKILLSFHPISINDFGVIVYCDQRGLKIDSNLFKHEGEVVKKREYNGMEIYELLKKGKTILSYSITDDLILVSNSSFLLEGALRLRKSDGTGLFKNSNPKLFGLPTLKADDGNAYLNVSNLVESAGLFLRPGEKGKNHGGSGLADLQFSENGVLLNGFVEESDIDWLTLFRNQAPQSQDIDQFVSNNVYSMGHYGFSNPDFWFQQQRTYSESQSAKSIDSLEKEMSRLSVSMEAVRKSIGNQLATCYLGKAGDEVTILKLRENVGRVSVFDELASKISTEKRDSLYVENYAGYQIKLIDYRNFLYQLFYPLSAPAEQSFFVRIGSYMIFSEDVGRVKLFIDDIDNENTWGKSVEWNKFLSTSLQESNISLFFDGKLTSIYLKDKLKDKWRRFVDSTSFLNIDKGSIQLSRLESNYYLNASLQFSNSEAAGSSSSLHKVTYDFGSSLVKSPTIVRSHLSRDIEIMIQDSAGNLHLLSKDLKSHWKKNINAPIVDEIQQIDFFTNGKLQYFFVAGNAVHAIDRTGSNVDGFPVELNAGIQEYAAVVDYDRSKRYRYLFADSKGKLILTNKNGSGLDGWNPRIMGGKLMSAPNHYRVLGKDYFIAIQQNGVVNLLNRRGEMAKGYPLDLNIRPMGDYFLTLKSSLSASYFTVVSNDGLKVEFGLDGQVKKREALIKRIGATSFSMVKTNDGESFVFLRVDPGKLAVLDPEGRMLYEIENPGSVEWELSYLENRLKQRYYCFYDKFQNFSYIITSAGQLMLSQPIESTQHPALYYDEKMKTLFVYNVSHSQVTQISIKD